MLLMSIGTIIFAKNLSGAMQGMDAEFSWKHIVILAVPFIAMFISILEDYNVKVDRMLVFSFIGCVLCLPVAILVTKIFTLSCNACAWYIAEWWNYFFTAVLILRDGYVELRYRSKHGLPVNH